MPLFASPASEADPEAHTRHARNIDERHQKRQIILQSESFPNLFIFSKEQASLSPVSHIHCSPTPHLQGSHLHFAPCAIKLRYRNAFCIKICRG